MSPRNFRWSSYRCGIDCTHFSLLRWHHGAFVESRWGIPASCRCCRAGSARPAHCALYRSAFPLLSGNWHCASSRHSGLRLLGHRARRHWISGGFALAAQIAFLIFVGTYAASPLLAPSPISDPLPQASPPDGMAIYALPTGVNHRTAAFAYRGGSPWDKRDSVSTAVLVRHPQGDLLIDTGLGKTIAEQMGEFPFLFRLGTDLVRFQAAADQLDAAGYDRTQLRYILLTHAHWDHVSGVPDFPAVPVLVTAAEHRFIYASGFPNAPARTIDPKRYQDYGFDGGRYLG